MALGRKGALILAGALGAIGGGGLLLRHKTRRAKQWYEQMNQGIIPTPAARSSVPTARMLATAHQLYPETRGLILLPNWQEVGFPRGVVPVSGRYTDTTDLYQQGMMAKHIGHMANYAKRGGTTLYKRQQAKQPFLIDHALAVLRGQRILRKAGYSKEDRRRIRQYQVKHMLAEPKIFGD